jgi:hypothetical protein
MKSKTSADFENSLEYWRDLARMLKPELASLRTQRDEACGGYRTVVTGKE